VANLFQDHMVLQRDKPVKVWGWADAETKVTVQFADQKKTATTDKNGKWLVTLDPMKASVEGRELHVRCQGSGDRRQGTGWACLNGPTCSWAWRAPW
jgi:sialate O-acetylesterase